MPGLLRGRSESGVADEIFGQSSVIINNQWDFYFDDYQAMKFKVTDINIPTKKFTSETHNTGEKYYTGFTPEDEFTIMFREDSDFNVLRYFSEWEAEFYNEKGEFVSMPRGTKKGSTQDKLHRTGSFVLNAYKRKGTTKNLLEELLVLSIPIKYTPQILDRGRRIGEFVTGKSFLRKPPHIKKPASRPDFLPKHAETVVFTIKFKNMKFLGIDPVDFDYTTGEPLTYSVSFVADEVIVDIPESKGKSKGSKPK